jgi:hypothetical protein
MTEMAAAMNCCSRVSRIPTFGTFLSSSSSLLQMLFYNIVGDNNKKIDSH